MNAFNSSYYSSPNAPFSAPQSRQARSTRSTGWTMGGGFSPSSPRGWPSTPRVTASPYSSQISDRYPSFPTSHWTGNLLPSPGRVWFSPPRPHPYYRRPTQSGGIPLQYLNADLHDESFFMSQPQLREYNYDGTPSQEYYDHFEYSTQPRMVYFPRFVARIPQIHINGNRRKHGLQVSDDDRVNEDGAVEGEGQSGMSNYLDTYIGNDTSTAPTPINSGNGNENGDVGGGGGNGNAIRRGGCGGCGGIVCWEIGCDGGCGGGGLC
ncbi:hypothetical protein I302_104334 [Kwoniella bestiolae CBS 10118]|uniref:Uncharacterized protein n=1 Tax=Kwoniella bestiolae CBS 10118 TaxID=1296100 RepID=A0A1B9GB00_9TREE|nr:hypothetical protein I302_03042 [Kwoniella bestiolae CBS 10118]OCF28190.1 hypothetical protein I302_03042 [Kwoniella bestiolae CBS 10118]